MFGKIKYVRCLILEEHCIPIVKLWYGGIWSLRKQLIDKKITNGVKFMLYESYWTKHGSYIGLGAKFEDIPVFPHGPIGVFISNSAKIGKHCVIFQHVTIGSNTLKDSNSQGAPTIGENVYIGCGAKIIGNVCVGNNARVGANAIIVKDVPANSVTVIRGAESIIKNRTLNNEFVVNAPKL